MKSMNWKGARPANSRSRFEDIEQDVVGALKPLPAAAPDIRIYDVAVYKNAGRKDVFESKAGRRDR